MQAYVDQTIPDRICFWGETEPDMPAFIFWSKYGRYVLSRGDVLDLSSRFAFRLTEHGVQPGDVVCIALPNCPERVVVDFGVHLAGGVSMNGQILRSDGQDIIESMRKAKCKTLVIDPNQENGAWGICSRIFKVVSDGKYSSDIKCANVPSLKNVAYCKTKKPECEFLRSLPSCNRYVNNKMNPSDVAQIFTTSGSSGYTKLVQHSHKAILTMGKMLLEMAGAKGRYEKSIYTSAPLGWVGGYPIYFLYAGLQRVLIDDSVGVITDNHQFTWNVICQEDIKLAHLSSFQIVSIFKQRDMWESKSHKLHTILTGGQPLKKGCLEPIGQLTDAVCNIYGSTEMGLINGFIFNDENVSDFKENIAGFAAAGVDVKIVDSNMAEVKTEAHGEIIVRSENTTKGYYGDTHSSFLPDGWFRTGDVGYEDARGCLFVEGRSSDAIMHGPYILYPTWLEEKLAKCPGIKQTFIVPIPDKVLHHEICACVQLEQGAQLTKDDIINFVKGEVGLGISSAMNVVPKHVEFFDTFPVLNSFKVNRKQLAKFATERLQL
ncbi:3-[(3aS,4S,7aS)-7a-methyl-1,5-dioxo-octahydro-1H-inden-4-yl]propanoyl:CoA ligase-like [Haliotis rufescens]|uniref:3-[(3aS,4S,7aS)-7a-methyl-1, 5-dioxo-octahydro-1H-inden-4-yl]propanoyl:CoA ligase-like n=1 Tax=Haliotis rufescens TaxID=6454 RepID=UPI00201EC738|nr:3-[(3aS,4S,7aS)-7a-methyl-1,5-dioxo-octahydro-1H-inden-4-yl]propanoyl:CoA ligase-like [Haliotis rufescens]